MRVKSRGPEPAGPDVYRSVNIPDEAFHRFFSTVADDDMFGAEKNLSIGIYIPERFKS